MVDYSKWDSLDASDDESGNKPRIHRFEKPQQVTIGGSSGHVQVSPSVEAAPKEQEEATGASDDEPMEPSDGEEGDFDGSDAQRGEDRREDVLQCRALAERALRDGEASEAIRLVEKAMRLGGAQCPGMEDLLVSARRKATEGGAVLAASSSRPSTAEDRRANGGTVEGRYSWSQTRETVDVNVFVPEGTKAKAVQVNASETRVCITVAGTRLLEGQWEFKIEPEEDPDWQVLDSEGRRVVRLMVRKAAVPGGLSVVVWWQRLLKGDPGIDVSSIEGRKKEKTEAFAKAWEEAHVKFREKVQTQRPISVDVGEEESAMQD